jgi:hypothetical protein
MRVSKWIGVLAAVVLLSGTGYFWVSQKMEWGWQKNTAKVVTSPDGQWRASLIFAEPGSAFGGVYNEVTLDRVGGVPSIWLPFRQVFISSLSEGPLNTVMDWSRDGVLQIAYPDDVDVLKHSTTFDGVKVEYQSEHLGRPNTAILAAN